MANLVPVRTPKHHASQVKDLHNIPLKPYQFTPSNYPGRRPRFSFFFTAKGIYRLKSRSLDVVLKQRGLPLSGERYAILAYGSNACPGQLLDKHLDDIPVLFGRLVGAEAVYANRQTQKGYVPATLARKRGSRSSWVTLLTADQLEIMDGSEGRHYHTYVLAELPNVQFFIGQRQITPLYSYVDMRGGVMTRNGKPAGLRSMGQKRAKALVRAEECNAAKWLNFQTIPDPNPPAQFSKILNPMPRRRTRSAAK
ncbi:MAG TPA: hypothetical protein VFI95_11370 [Terriglobales bacterium]|nr:hypothetical protein [Terriglobales bacterium]